MIVDTKLLLLHADLDLRREPSPTYQKKINPKKYYFAIRIEIGRSSFVHNGNIQGIDYNLNDSLELFNNIKTNLNEGNDMKSILIDILQRKKGIYNLIIQTQDGLYLVKDRFGVRPFFHGYKKVFSLY